jgi:lysine-ketoglutarate reductase/saccharopine dehydrogenase-like protein (TIGR00300 family)
MGLHEGYPYREEVELRGHIIDSLLLPKVLDIVLEEGGSFELEEVRIGRRREDPSYARIEVRGRTEEQLATILRRISNHGATPVEATDCELVPADLDGAFPDGFYSTTNQRTEVRIGGRWVEVQDQEMDGGIVVDPSVPSARCIPMIRVRRGDPIVVGHRGVRVTPLERPVEGRLPAGFHFMASSVSIEKPKGTLIKRVAAQMLQTRREGKKILLVAGPAVVHTGSAHYVAALIREGFVQVLFGGNALGAHDVEYALYGTSLGVYVDRGTPAQRGHEHHLRAINAIRRCGGIRQAVEKGLLRSGILYECIRREVPFLLAGSIRDDGPLPEVITDVLEAQDRMRAMLKGVGFALMIASVLHAVATGNLLPAWVPTVYVDMNPAAVTKLVDRGTFQSTGIVTDVEPFLRVLLQELRQQRDAI